MPKNDLQRYYSKRAPEYDSIYGKPERGKDLLTLERMVSSQLAGLDVLEIACGTGYWTQRIGGAANSVLATDASARMLELAGRRAKPDRRVQFQEADAFALELDSERRFNGCFAGFWWSHVPRSRWTSFLSGLHERLEPGARCIFVDNRFVEGESTPIAHLDEAGDTYQDRQLLNGSTYRVLKNFPQFDELHAGVAGVADHVELTELDYFWCLSYEYRPTVSQPHLQHMVASK
jgi:SAM-dependent methyltransferase